MFKSARDMLLLLLIWMTIPIVLGKKENFVRTVCITKGFERGKIYKDDLI